MVELSQPPRAIVVCPVVPFPPVTGGQKRTLRLLEAMDRAGLRPHVVTVDGAAPAAAAALRERGWAVDVLEASEPDLRGRLRQHAARRPSPALASVAARVSALSGAGAALLQLEHTQSAYYLRAEPPTLLSLHNLDSAALRTAARHRRPGSVAWLRAWNRAAATRSVERRAFPRAELVACVTEAEAAAVERLGGRPLVAPNGVDDDLLTVPADSPAGEEVLFFGGLGYEPNRGGLERFVAEAWPEVRRRRPTARLTVAGPGATAPKGLARAAGRSVGSGGTAGQALAGSGVRVVGAVDDLAALLAEARVVVVPVWEGGGTRLKALEALAAARPVVGTALGLGGIGLTPGREGLVADDPRGLADAVAALLGDAERARTMGAEGRRLVAPRRWSATLAPLEERYRAWAAAASSAA